MKIIIITAFFLVYGFTGLNAQIGLNTSNSRAEFHVDAAKDNPTTGIPTATQQLNDFTATTTGSVGIGTISPNANSALDVISQNKGVKFPSVALIATNNPSPLTAHVAGMVVYNTATAGAIPNNVIPGLYTNNGSRWVHLETQEESIPAGTVLYRASSVVPTGYLECNGAAVSRTTYAALFSIIGTTYGAGNGTTTFNLPDLRGEFIRGWDNSRGIDTGRVIGSWQKGSFIAGGAGPAPDGIIPFDNVPSGTQMPIITSDLGWDFLTNAIYTASYPSRVQVNNNSPSTTLTLITPNQATKKMYKSNQFK